jgi:hypothetical protein
MTDIETGGRAALPSAATGPRGRVGPCAVQSSRRATTKILRKGNTVPYGVRG